MSNDPQYDITDVTKNQALLDSMRPGSGRRINEDAEIINIADAFEVIDGELTLRLSLGGGGTITLDSLIITNDLDVGGDLTVDGDFNFGDASTDLLKVNGQLQLADGTATDPALTFIDQTTLGIYRRGSNLLSFATNGALVGEFSSSGFNVNRITALTGDTINTTSRIDQEIIKTLSGTPAEEGFILDHTIDGTGEWFGQEISIESGGFIGELIGGKVEIEAHASDDGGNFYGGVSYSFTPNGALGEAVAITVDENWTYAMQIYSGNIRSYDHDIVIDNYRANDGAGDGNGFDTSIYAGQPLGSGDYDAGNLLLGIQAPIGAGVEGEIRFMRAGSIIATIDAGGGLSTDGGRWKNVTTVNVATYDLLTSDDIVAVTYTATGAVTSLTLPTAQTVAGRTITIKDEALNAGTNNITIDTEGAQTIDGSSTLVINGDGDWVVLYSNGTNWFRIG
ncbi:MAG: hypothetical protein GY781_13855 [Gammaproteobacteria bacterium]|nr:hypothetical protein [Gammaproteobacteria bacterium]